MLFERFVGEQLAHPSGFFSGITALGMNRINDDINKATIELLDVKPGDRVLDVGFGGGAAIRQMARLAGNGLVAGIDISDSMVKRGQRRYSKSVSMGRVQLKKADVSHIPYETGFFDKACAVMAVYFWPEPVRCLNEIRRVLKDGGRIVLGARPKEWMDRFPPARHGFVIYSDDQLWSLLSEAGFSDVRTELRETPLKSTLLVGTKK